MRTNDILNALKKFGKDSALCGLATTAVVEGGLMVYHNVGDYLRKTATEPTDATLEQCLDSWNAEHIREITLSLITLAIFLPATLLRFIYLLFSERDLADDSTRNEGLALVREAQPRQEITLMKVLYNIVLGLTAALFVEGILAPMTWLKALNTSSFQGMLPNATAEKCYEAWKDENIVYFIFSLTPIIGGFFIGLMLYKLSNPGGELKRAASSVIRDIEPPALLIAEDIIPEEERAGYSSVL